MEGTEVRIRINGEELKLCFESRSKAFDVMSAIYDGASEYDHQNFGISVAPATEKA